MAGYEDPDFREGVRHFNEGRFFEAHEAWELLWRRAEGASPEREIVQGLIQLAAACHHLTRNNPSGAEGCLKNAHKHLDPYIKDVSEFDLSGFIEGVERSVVQKTPATVPHLLTKRRNVH